VLFCYPFDGDPREIDKAALGLQVLNCVMKSEGGKNEMNKTITCKKQDESQAVITRNVRAIRRLAPPTYFDDTLIDFFL
jgi:hypothetical protein